jgi:transcription antitermination factor NusG
LPKAVQCLESAADTAKERGACQWFATHTNSCREKRVADHCSVRGIESFLPTYQSTKRWRNGCTVKLDRPLFPGYLFVRVDPAYRVRVLELPGVVAIVGNGRQPIPLPDADINALRNGVRTLNAEPHRYLKVGERARIRAGAFEGMTGILVRRKNSLRVVLTVELIMKSISVEVAEQDLELLGQERALRDMCLVDGTSHFPAVPTGREVKDKTRFS